MKKLLLLLVVCSLGFSAYVVEPNIRIDETNAKVSVGRETVMLQVKNKAIAVSPNQTLTWYVDNISGMNTMALYGVKVKKGSTSTVLTGVGNCTMNVQAVQGDGTALYGVSAQTIINGGTLATIKSPFYKITYTVPTINATNIDLIFFVKD